MPETAVEQIYSLQLIIGVVGGSFLMLIAVIGWFVRDKFHANEREHDRINQGVQRVDSKIDHILFHHEPKLPPYNHRADQ